MKNKKSIIIGSAVVLIALFFIAGNLYQSQQNAAFVEKAKQANSEFLRPHSMTLGDKNAKVYLVEFFDPACGTCAQFYPLVKDIMKKNEGNIRLILRYAPYHQGSDFAVKMLEAARVQGKFWETLELMFASQRSWINNHQVLPSMLWKIVAKLDLDIEKLSKDMQNPNLDALIAQDLQDAKVLGATKTPSYYVNGIPLRTFGYEPLKELIYSQL